MRKREFYRIRNNFQRFCWRAACGLSDRLSPQNKINLNVARDYEILHISFNLQNLRVFDGAHEARLC